ncbi:MAG: sigma-70 family RNA polymerase sigma factor [Chitinophagaceae bacterium]|nr:sigma-70 family RNA polymerase sigma factor [Chitinophagaceae bacterium]
MEVVKNYTDSELLEALRSGRGMNPVLKFLYRQNFEVLKVYVIQNSGSEQDAEDIFQEVLVSFIELVRLEKFRGDSSVKTFLYALTRNTWLNELKRKGRADVREMKFEKAKDTIDEDAAQKIAGRESRKQVMDVVEKLGEQCKKILLAYYYEDRSMKEIVDIAGYDSEQVVRNKKYKCLKQLEQMLTADPNMAKTLKKALNYE